MTVNLNVSLVCNSVTVASVQNLETSINGRYQITIPEEAIGVCDLFGQPDPPSNDYFNTNTINNAVYQQLQLNSSVIGWTGGDEVEFIISALELESQWITAKLTCPTATFTQRVFIDDLHATLQLPNSLNGIGCVLETVDLPQYYLPIPKTKVNVACSTEMGQSIFDYLQLSNFFRRR